MGKNVLTWCGFILACLATLFIIVAFSSSHWLESYPEANSRFLKLGLWEACFKQFAYERDNLGKVYDGCEWIFSYDYRPIFSWLVPRWLLAVQVMMTLCMILSLVVSILCLLGLLGHCPPQRAATAQLTNAILMFTAAALVSISVVTFGVQADVDRQWIPRPDQNYLSWSFGLGVVGGFFSIFSGMCLLVDSLRLSAIRRKAKTPPPYSGYEMKREPPQY